MDRERLVFNLSYYQKYVLFHIIFNLTYYRNMSSFGANS